MSALAPALLGLLLQSSGLLLLGLAALWLTRRQSPAVQSLVGRAALAGIALLLLLAPLTGHVRPLWRIAASPPAPRQEQFEELTLAQEPTPPQAATLPKREGGVRGSLPGLPVPLSLSREDETSRLASRSPSRFGRVAACGGVGSCVWAVGTALLLLWLGACQWHLTRLRRGAVPVTSGPATAMLAALTPRPPRLLVHPSVHSPFLAGLRCPTIFLPVGYETEFDAIALRAILVHELAHLARRDNAWTLAARLLCTALWPQPLLWLLCRRLDQIGEDACDEAVLAQNCPPRAYADCLLALAARHPLGRRERALGAGVAPFRSSLGQRITRILTKGTHTMSTISLRLRLTAAALTVAAALGGVFLVSSAPAQIEKPSLIGTWLGPDYGGTRSVLIFSSNGQFESISPWPSETRVGNRFYGNNTRISHSYGPYAIEGSKLKYTDMRVWVEGEKPWKTDPYMHLMDYTLSGDSLTLRLAGKFTNVSHRVPAYAAEMLGIKPDTSPDAKLPAARRLQLSDARFLAGLTPVQGPGVVVTLNDSKHKSPAKMPSGFSPPNIIHDTDINAVVNELKAAGAEAIAVNDQRLVATSSIRSVGATTLVNYVPVSSPFVIQAIGNPKTLAAAMNLAGGVASQLKTYDPAMFSVRETEMLTLPAYSGGGVPRYAKPVEGSEQTQVDAGRGKLLELDQQSTEAKARLAENDAEAASLRASIQGMRQRIFQQGRKLTPPLPPTTMTRDEIRFNINPVNKGKTLEEQLAAMITTARKQLTKTAFLPGQNPTRTAAQDRLNALLEKQQFLTNVHNYQRKWVTLYNEEADRERATADRLISTQRSELQLQNQIAAVDALIADANARSTRPHTLAPGH